MILTIAFCKTGLVASLRSAGLVAGLAVLPVPPLPIVLPAVALGLHRLIAALYLACLILFHFTLAPFFFFTSIIRLIQDVFKRLHLLKHFN
jgi:hypothetical protein